MTAQKNRYSDTNLHEPDERSIPADMVETIRDLFDTWHSVRARNERLTRYYEMKNSVKDFGISIPPQLVHVDEVVGWAAKAVNVRAVRSRFDGFVFSGEADDSLDDLVERNNLRSLVSQASRSAMVHGVSAITVMRGTGSQPGAKVRAFSANQCCMLWDKDEDGIGAGIVLSRVDRSGSATRYVVHMRDKVVTFELVDPSRNRWEASEERNPVGDILMVPIIHAPDLDRPLGCSVLTPELLSIVDKAVRDVLRMDVGAEFFTAPQRYALGVADDLFSSPVVDDDGRPVLDPETGEPIMVQDEAKRLRAYLGAIWAITGDGSGEKPTVGQFPAGDAGNFIKVFENDAQRFSGAANVPLGQLGVLSNTYTSSDALGAANDPLILDVQAFNDGLRGSLRQVARLMMAVSHGITLGDLSPWQDSVRAYIADPSMPTIAAVADAWTKIASQDHDIVGTPVWYEKLGVDQATIDRIETYKRRAAATSTLARIADAMGAAPNE